MNFRLSEDTLLLKNSAERFLKQKCPASLVKELLKDETGFSKELWKEMADLGWLGVIYEEAYGGSGASFLDLFILFEEIGKVLLPSPFFCSAVLSGLIINEAADSAVKNAYLPLSFVVKKYSPWPFSMRMAGMILRTPACKPEKRHRPDIS